MIPSSDLTGIPTDSLPIYHICPACGVPALTGKSERYATAWELVHGRTYPNIDYSIPCWRHEVTR